MSAQHTPGPWRFITDPHDDDGWIVVAGEGSHAMEVAAVAPLLLPMFANIEIANGRLIAAAPDLLALAKQYASECGECNGLGYTLGANAEHVDCPDCADIRAVITKAEGQR